MCPLQLKTNFFENVNSCDTICDRTLFGTDLKNVIFCFDSLMLFTYGITSMCKDILNAGGV